MRFRFNSATITISLQIGSVIQNKTTLESAFSVLFQSNVWAFVTTQMLLIVSMGQNAIFVGGEV